jgi:pre-mRNA-splicing factor SYF1
MLDTGGGNDAQAKAHHLVLDEHDLAYEEEILRNPNSTKPWIRYIEHKADAPKNILNLVFERALKELPGSYKLWYNYLKVRMMFQLN